MGVQGDKFIAEVEAFMAQRAPLVDGAAVVVGVSGGADSVALASALRAIGRHRLHLAHVHHGLRGADADADADFVGELASNWQLPFHLERIDTTSLAREWSVGTEEAARRARYQALASTAGQVGAEAVAVGHHADDQIETVLHRIIRGTHLRGLSGMRPKRPLSDGVTLIRPLLWARREAIEDYCRAEGLSWQTDHTNLQNDFTRNFIRNELLPLLRKRLNPRADEALLRISAAAGASEAAMEELAGRLFERACRKRSDHQIVLRMAPLRKAPPVVAAAVFRIGLAAISAPQKEMTHERYDDLLGLLGGRVPALELPGEVRAERRGQAIWLFRRTDVCEQGH